MDRLQGKTALVTGGAMGIGRACAELFAREGARVVVTDVDDVNGESTVDGICTAGGEAIYLHHDVTAEDAWQSVLDAIGERYGQLHILVNNAGIAIGKPLLDMTLDEFHKQNAVNLDGVFLGLKFCIPAIASAGGGSIINLSSAAGLKGAPGLAAYSMTKGGVRLLTKSVARECADAGNRVRVNSVHPGIIETAIWDKMGLLGEPGANQVDVGGIATNIVPGGVLGTPAYVANGILFLASDESSYMTGSELVIDHGFTA
ncbi:MAG: glucose 1-dehydrogenase [Pseudomonadales bacterium]|nr:glucose 1-dehydrogenase [Pseudomonadales bacterium]